MNNKWAGLSNCNRGVRGGGRWVAGCGVIATQLNRTAYPDYPYPIPLSCSFSSVPYLAYETHLAISFIVGLFPYMSSPTL